MNCKRQCQETETSYRLGENIVFAEDGCTDKGLLCKIYQELLRLKSKRTNNLIEKWCKDLNRYLTREDMQMANKHRKRCSISCVIIEMQIKTTIRHHHTPSRISQNLKPWQHQMLTKMWSNKSSPSLLMGIQNGTATLRHICWFLTKLDILLYTIQQLCSLAFTQSSWKLVSVW